MQSISANSSIKTDDININSNGLSNTNLTYDNSEVDSSDKKTESDRQDEDDNLDIKNNVIEVDAGNFLHTIDKLIENADKYEGQ